MCSDGRDSQCVRAMPQSKPPGIKNQPVDNDIVLLSSLLDLEEPSAPAGDGGESSLRERETKN